MYFNGKLEIDPSQITVYKKVKPTKLFGKLKDVLSFGTLTPKQEHETFTAVAILQQMNMGLRSIKVCNVIRLAVDDYDFYLDEKGVDDDLEQAIFEFKAKIDPMESELFNVIYLVLEHNDNELKYLIEISINRKHRVGEYPITINVNGVISELIYDETDQSKKSLENKLKDVFSSQESYNKYVDYNKRVFDKFLAELEMAIQKFVRVDDVIVKSNTLVIRPSEKVESISGIKHERYADPIYYGYYGIDNYLFYTYIWSGLMYSSNIMVADTLIVDNLGNPIMNVGSDGFFAGDTNTMNPDAPFEVPNATGVEYYGGNEYSDYLMGLNLVNVDSYSGFPADDLGDTSSNWLDVSGGYDEDTSSSSCSSCSSCGSCSNN